MGCQQDPQAPWWWVQLLKAWDTEFGVMEDWERKGEGWRWEGWHRKRRLLGYSAFYGNSQGWSKRSLESNIPSLQRSLSPRLSYLSQGAVRPSPTVRTKENKASSTAPGRQHLTPTNCVSFFPPSNSQMTAFDMSPWLSESLWNLGLSPST